MRVVRLILVLGFALLSLMTTQAQTGELIAYANGDLFAWSQFGTPPEQLTFWGFNGGGLMSPDGTKIAFISYDGVAGEEIASGERYNEFGDTPNNIWVMDIATREFQWINDQTGGGDSGIVRSYPVWSPDGTRLAWTELVNYSNSYLKTYDFNTGEITTLVENFDMGYQDAGIYMPVLQWGGGGISRILETIVGDDFEWVRILEVYDPDTGKLTSMELDFLDPDGFLSFGYLWAKDGNKDVVALLVGDQWGIADPFTNAYSPLKGSPVLQLQGGDSVQVIPVYANGNINWYVNNNGAVSDLHYSTYSIRTGGIPTLAPTGDRVAWYGGDGVYIWEARGQSISRVIVSDELAIYNTPEPANAVWAPTEWVIGEQVPLIVVMSPTEVPPTAIPQPTAVPQSTSSNNGCKTAARLIPGQYAILSPGQNNNVRQSYSTNSELFGEIYPGEIVYVDAGPVCAEGINWYLVSNEFIYGWTAEGFNGDYWLTANMDFDNCWNSPPARLTPGAKGTVLSGSPNRIRQQPGIGNSPVLGEIPPNGVFFIDGNPLCGDDGRRWWPVTYAGVSGWTPEGEGSTYWVRPGG